MSSKGNKSEFKEVDHYQPGLSYKDSCYVDPYWTKTLDFFGFNFQYIVHVYTNFFLYDMAPVVGFIAVFKTQLMVLSYIFCSLVEL